MNLCIAPRPSDSHRCIPLLTHSGSVSSGQEERPSSEASWLRLRCLLPDSVDELLPGTCGVLGKTCTKRYSGLFSQLSINIMAKTDFGRGESRREGWGIRGCGVKFEGKMSHTQCCLGDFRTFGTWALPGGSGKQATGL